MFFLFYISLQMQLEFFFSGFIVTTYQPIYISSSLKYKPSYSWLADMKNDFFFVMIGNYL